MSEFLKMAEMGIVLLIGKGNNRVNPIHGCDLAKVCVDAIVSNEHEISVGGPVAYTGQEIAELAFSTLGKVPRVIHIPPLLAQAALKLIRPFNRQMSDLVDFIAAAGQGDDIAPITGSQMLESYHRELSSSWLINK